MRAPNVRCRLKQQDIIAGTHHYTWNDFSENQYSVASTRGVCTPKCVKKIIFTHFYVLGVKSLKRRIPTQTKVGIGVTGLWYRTLGKGKLSSARKDVGCVGTQI